MRRRRRNNFQVSTFPFMAVMLAAMGSLILLMFVFDRRAKIVARHRVAVAREQQDEAESARLQKRQAYEDQVREFEQRRQALHQLFLDQGLDLRGKIDDAQARAARAASALERARAVARDIQKHLEDESTRMNALRLAIAKRKNALDQSTQQSAAARKQLEKMEAELLELENTITQLKLLKSRQTNLYSVVPYTGRQGDARKPVYLECAESSVIAHPEKRPVYTSAEVRSHVMRQILLTKEKGYVLLLVRPEGIYTYSQVVTALEGLDVDFGYEFIENDWVLDFPNDGDEATPQPWMANGNGGARPGYRPGGGGTLNGPDDPGAGRGVGVGAGRGSGTGNSDSGPPASEFGKPAHLDYGLSGNGAGAGRGGSGSDVGTGPGGRGANPGGRGIGSGGSGSGSGTGADMGRGPDGRGTGPGGTGSGLAPGGRGTGPDMGFGPGGRGTGPVGNGSGTEVGLAPGATGTTPGGNGTGSERGNGGRGNGDLPANAHVAGNRETGAPGVFAPKPTDEGPVLLNGGNGQGTATGPRGTGSESGSDPVGSAAGNGSSASLAPPRILPFDRFGPPGTPGSQDVPNLPQPGQPVGSGGTANGSKNGANQPGGKNSANQPGGNAGGGNDGPQLPGSPPGGLNIQMGQNKDRQAVIKTDEDHLLRTPGSSGGGSNRLSGGGTPGSGAEAPGKPKPPPAIVHINRDFFIPIECTADGVLIHNTGQRIELSDLMRHDDNPLTSAVTQIIERRQKTVPEGVPPWKPQIRFLVGNKGLRAYYLAYPKLEYLNVPMMRVNTDNKY